jgi:acyl-CoA dehydrogenase
LVSFKPTDEEQAFVELAKSFAREKIRPSARDAEHNKHVSEEIINKALELGFTALELPETWNGLEMPLISQVQILEALSNGDLAVLQGVPGCGDAAFLIRLDSENPALASLKAEKSPKVAFIHDRENSFTIEVNGNDYILNGISVPIKMAESANYLILASTDTKGVPLIFLLNNDSMQQQWKTMIGDYRLGLLASGCACIQIDHLRVSKKQILSKGDAARHLLDESLARLRIIEAAKEVGLMNAALSYATQYTTERKAFGEKIAKFQGVSFTIAQMAIQTKVARNLVWFAAKKIDQQERDGKVFSLSALHSAHRSLRFVTDSAVQLLGGHGYVQDHPVEKWMRDAQAQINLFESEDDLIVRSGEFLLLGDERRQANDFV